MRECKPHPLLYTCGSECGGTHSNACHSGAPDFPYLRVYFRGPLALVNLVFHFSRVVMRFVKVACVSATLTPCYSLVPHSGQPLSLTHATPLPLISRSFASIPQLTPLGLVNLGFHFGRVVMRFVEVACMSTRLTPFLRTCAS